MNAVLFVPICARVRFVTSGGVNLTCSNFCTKPLKISAHLVCFLQKIEREREREGVWEREPKNRVEWLLQKIHTAKIDLHSPFFWGGGGFHWFPHFDISCLFIGALLPLKIYTIPSRKKHAPWNLWLSFHSFTNFLFSIN